MTLLSGFTNWLRGLGTPARTTGQMLADIESDHLVGTERRRGQPGPGPLAGTHAPGRPVAVPSRDERRK